MGRLISFIAMLAPTAAFAQAQDGAFPLPSPSVIGLVVAGTVAVGVVRYMRRK